MSPIETAAIMTDSASVDFEIPAPGTPGHVEWRKTGKLPDGTEPAFEKHEETEVHEAKEVEAEPPAADED